MKDIPMFTTEYGVASLVLRELPYTRCAYVRIRTASDAEKLVSECVGFCRAAGAERVYAAGDVYLENYPLHTSVIRMSAAGEQLGETDASIFPVTERTLGSWLEIYRGKVIRVPNGAWMTDADGKEMLRQGNGYFVHRDGSLLGIGRADGDRLHFLASVCRGAGMDVVRALCHALTSEQVILEVASENHKAMRLYEDLGFVKNAELSRWYKIL